MKFDKSKGWDILKLFLFEWFFISLILLFIIGFTGIAIAFVISVIMTVVVVILYRGSWSNIKNQLPHR